ncbi:hypothetical protein [Flavobacterium sp. UBA7663]|uniref:hypothetical protein n=1 Tax=Flavobacterium sp. UBA7663 TaxID=1946557 RepID=UPI0025B893F6|nr:hypothetical protein [Flavobacterium sp. UBA7663]
MRDLLLILLLTISNNIFAQTKTDTIPSIQNNLAWLDKLEQILDKEDKIKFIVKKIKSDSIYANTGVKLSTYISANGCLHNNFGNEIPCKLIFALDDKKLYTELDLNKFPEQSIILKHLNSETVDDITIFKGLSATSLFGIRGNCNVVYLKPNKKFRNLIKTK